MDFLTDNNTSDVIIFDHQISMVTQFNYSQIFLINSANTLSSYMKHKLGKGHSIQGYLLQGHSLKVYFILFIKVNNGYTEGNRMVYHDRNLQAINQMKIRKNSCKAELNKTVLKVCKSMLKGVCMWCTKTAIIVTTRQDKHVS